MEETKINKTKMQTNKKNKTAFLQLQSETIFAYSFFLEAVKES